MAYATLGDFLVSAPLYRTEVLPSAVAVREHRAGNYKYVPPPDVVDRWCETCGPTKWRYHTDGTNEEIGERYIKRLAYVCKDCEKQTFTVYFFWWMDGAPKFMKVGQFPKLEITIPKEFGEALGDKRPLYMKGMTLRHNAYGIGALTYFRRLIEDTTDEMLDLLERSMEETQSDPLAIEKLKKAKNSIRFDEKVRVAAEIIPPHLRPGGVNPFGDLYEMLSIGLHNLNDDECCEIVDAMDGSLKFIYTRLKTHVAEAKAFEEAAKSLNAKVAKYKQRDSQ